MPEPVRKRIGEMIAGKGRLVSQISVGGMPKDLILVDGNTFREVFTLNRPYIFHGEYTAAADENDYSNSRNFLTSDDLAGLSKKYREDSISL